MTRTAGEWRVCAVIVVALTLMRALPAPAQGLTLGVGASQAIYYPGDQLRLSVSASNAAAAGVADFYTGLILPDGVTVATIGTSGVRLGTLAHPSTFVPVATGIDLASPFVASVDPLFAYIWSGAEPPGAYTLFIVAVRAGAFADDRIDAGDILALQTGGLHVRPRAQVVVSPGGGSTARVTPDAGGVVSVTGTSGTVFTLTLPPGAVEEPTDITAIPVAATGLPLDRLLGAVRFAPDGLVLQAPATLTVNLPPGRKPIGTVGFTMKDDGSGFETVPLTVVGDVATVRLGHFSSAGVGQSLCGATVTTAVGRDACRVMARALADAAAIIEQGTGGTPLPVRVLLGSELQTALGTWLHGLVSMINVDTANGIATGHYLFMVALREIDVIHAIIELIEGLDIGPVVLQEVRLVEDVIPSSIAFLRREDNRECLANKDVYRDWLRRLFELAGESRERGLPVDGNTHGISCVEISLTISLATVVPPAGAPLTIEAGVRFSDGTPLPDSPVVTLEAVSDGRARLSSPTFAQGPRVARLNTVVAPPTTSATSLQFQLRVAVPELGLTKISTVRRGNVGIVSRAINGDFSARAGTAEIQRSLTGSDRVDESLDALAPSPARARAASRAAGAIAGDLSAGVEVSASVYSTASADEDFNVSAAAGATLESRVTLDLDESVTCRFEVATRAIREGGNVTSTTSVAVTRDGTPVLETSQAGEHSMICAPGRYVIGVSVAVSTGTTSSGPTREAGRDTSVTLSLTP